MNIDPVRNVQLLNTLTRFTAHDNPDEFASLEEEWGMEPGEMQQAFVPPSDMMLMYAHSADTLDGLVLFSDGTKGIVDNGCVEDIIHDADEMLAVVVLYKRLF